jgi:hypothetical protein
VLRVIFGGPNFHVIKSPEGILGYLIFYRHIDEATPTHTHAMLCTVVFLDNDESNQSLGSPKKKPTMLADAKNRT